jgi:PERQ amino acid-rich with GYF domain-containing protein
MKPQTQKDASGAAPIGTRKTSLSSYNTSTNAVRPGTRRRETSESYSANGPLSPTESKTFFRTESNTATPPTALLRRRTDFKDDEPSPDQKEAVQSKDDTGDAAGPFGSLRRSGTAPMAAPLNTSVSSPWSAGPTSAFGTMGSFGSFNIGSGSAAESSEKRPGFGSARGGSRFKDLLSKTSTEDMASGLKEKGPFSGLEKLAEEDADSSQSRLRDMFKTRPNRSETNPYEDLVPRSGSAALSASQEHQPGVEQLGFSAFGGREFGNAEPGLPQQPSRFNEPMSPTNTNPYHSPHGNQQEEDDQSGVESVPQQPPPPFGPGRRGLFSDSESSQRSMAGFGGLPGFSGLGGAPTWSSGGLGSGTPARERNMASAFGDPIFSPLSDIQSPGAGLGGGFFGSSGFGAPGRSSRLGAMLPPAMHEQMRDEGAGDLPRGTFGSRPESAQQGARDPFDSGFARTSGAFDDVTNTRNDDGSAFGQVGAPGSSSGVPIPGSKTRASTGSELAQEGGNQMPAAQQRQMVMPDRMRWIYRDPQGTIQGPWSGLEMHDWFKAGFFTAELLVKKVEDTDFEPLAQLVRRIGNSREPFLVPQIGVPHGPSSSTPTSSWPNTTTTPGAGPAQPPFASAFPSFGTTLTAEQQNALERRKQEEQYLMARQKEHLAQQQMHMRQIHPSHNVHSLQHHSSAQSLHSQPSFGSIASPGAGFHPSPLPPIPSNQAVGPPQSSSGPTQSFGQEPELQSFMDRMNLNQRMQPGGPLGAPGDPQVSQMLQDRARLQQQQQQGDMRAHQEAFLGPQGRNDRLEEFKELRGPDEVGPPAPDQGLPQPIGAQRQAEKPMPAPIGHPPATRKPVPAPAEIPSLTEQVQWTAAHKEEQAVQPPPVSISPLPAPAAQRNRQHVAESLVPEPGSGTQTPIETPATSVAPWAERQVEIPKGPSLKEIQAAEAKKAAEQEAIAAAARRQQAEHERLAQEYMPPPAPGLPATSTWGATSSPSTPTATQGSVWAKPAAKPTTGTNGSAKKTLAQIQEEEKARKQRIASAAAAAIPQTSGSPTNVQGKRYAELASKAAPASQAAAVPSAWTTVGSSGKAKPPATIVATPQVTPRSVSSTTAAGRTRPTVQPTRSSATTEKSKAQEEFMKWVKGQFGKGLNTGLNRECISNILTPSANSFAVDTFVQDLLQLPPDVEIIADVVYASSQTLDGRRIAEEFVRRRKLADKGVVESATPAAAPGVVNGGEGKSGGGGWSEVAKKGPEKKEEVSANFKVVAGKKKGKR